MISTIALHLFMLAHTSGFTFQPYGYKLAQDTIQASMMFSLPVEDIMALGYKEAKFKRRSRYHNTNGTIDYGGMSLNSRFVENFRADLLHDFGITLTENEVYNDNTVLGAYRLYQIANRWSNRLDRFKVYNGGAGALSTGVSDAYASDMMELTSLPRFVEEVYPLFLKRVFLYKGKIPTDKQLASYPLLKYNLTVSRK